MSKTCFTNTLDFDADDAPLLTRDDLSRARCRIAGRDVSREEWAASVRKHLSEHRESVMLASAVVEAFKARVGETGDFQALIEDVLLRELHSH
jgi:hypothetical protein